MKKISYFPLAILIICLFVVLSISEDRSVMLRSSLFSISSKMFAKISAHKKYSHNASDNIDILNAKENILALENTLLKDQIEGVYEWLTFDQRIQDQFEKYQNLRDEKIDHLYWQDFFRRRSEELKNILEVQLQAIPAKIIFRDPSSWSSSVWINVGQKDNDSLGKLVIAKNSPVVLGDSLIGVVEHVGKNESRIRLITDSGLTPSVRAVRGKAKDREIMQLAVDLFERIHDNEELFESTENRDLFFAFLTSIIKKLKEKKTDYFLAKGVLQGYSAPLWKAHGQKLKGIGFNYDYEDKEGPIRELKSGSVLDLKYDFLSMPILEKGDLLVTTGLDGIFPAGLKVAIVSYVKDIKEGEYSYEIEAIPTTSNLSGLKMVFVLPPTSFEKK